MDEIITQLFNYIPERWRPYVAILLLFFYVFTKYRSYQKDKEITMTKASREFSEGRTGSSLIPASVPWHKRLTSGAGAVVRLLF